MSNKDTGSKQAAQNRGSSTATANDDESVNGVSAGADQAGKAQRGSGKTAKTKAHDTPPPPPPPESGAAGKSETGEPESADPHSAEPETVESETVEPEAKSTETTRPTPTAGDYAHTFSNSPDSTAVIPVVRDDDAKSTEVATTPSGRRASLKIAHVDPWSVTKIAFALSVALMIVAVIAVSILWVVLAVAGVWDQINSSVSTVLSDGSSRFEIQDYLGFGRIIGLTLILSAINVVIVTAITAIGTRLYNLGADLLGGIDVTFSED